MNKAVLTNSIIYIKWTTKTLKFDQKLDTYPLKSKTRQGYILLPLLSNVVLEALTNTNSKKRKENTQVEKKDIKLFVQIPWWST